MLIFLPIYTMHCVKANLINQNAGRLNHQRRVSSYPNFLLGLARCKGHDYVTPPLAHTISTHCTRWSVISVGSLKPVGSFILCFWFLVWTSKNARRESWQCNVSVLLQALYMLVGLVTEKWQSNHHKYCHRTLCIVAGSSFFTALGGLVLHGDSTTTPLETAILLSNMANSLTLPWHCLWTEKHICLFISLFVCSWRVPWPAECSRHQSLLHWGWKEGVHWILRGQSLLDQTKKYVADNKTIRRVSSRIVS